jgi:hypothetical protein
MSIDLTSEILAAHADQLNLNQALDKDAFLTAFPGKREELDPLLDVAARVKRTLKPVQPSPAFRERLHNGLMMAANYQQAHKILVERRDEPQWGWLLGAAALGSAAGILALVWRARTHEHRATALAEAEPAVAVAAR